MRNDCIDIACHQLRSAVWVRRLYLEWRTHHKIIINMRTVPFGVNEWPQMHMTETIRMSHDCTIHISVKRCLRNLYCICHTWTELIQLPGVLARSGREFRIYFE